jgi:hypothetical protein
VSDQHAADVLALVRELSDLEFRRGQLHARLEWHCRLRELSAQQADAAAGGPSVVEVELVRPVKGPRHTRRVSPAPPGMQTRIFAAGGLRAAILAHLAEHPDRTPRQVAHAVNGHYESTRQALIRMAADGVLKRTMGGSYAVAAPAEVSSASAEA